MKYHGYKLNRQKHTSPFPNLKNFIIIIQMEFNMKLFLTEAGKSGKLSKKKLIPAVKSLKEERTKSPLDKIEHKNRIN